MAGKKAAHPGIVQTQAVIHTDHADIQSMIHIVRGQQVMLDSDLAALYQTETKRLNERVKRNPARFPDSFCFQLTKDEYAHLRSQFATSSDEYGGRRYLPYVFTEGGIAMLSAVLNSETAIGVSIRIMNEFVAMRHFLANNAALFERMNAVELKQLAYQKSTDEKFDKVFRYIEDHAESEQKVFFAGQIYDAFSLITSIIRKAYTDIILIDGYVDVDTLNILAKKNADVHVRIYTYANTKLTSADAANFNAQYPSLTIKKTQFFHDRFLILDGSTAYHIGASIKDAGKKCFGISLIEDPDLVTELLNRLKNV